jgi:NADPH2:quinone reductase
MATSAQTIEFDQPGGPEVLQWRSRPLASPAAGEVLIEQSAIGVNFIDIQHRSGRYPIATFPSSLGIEASGHVLAVGEGVDDFAVGDRVAYIHLPIGAYTTHRILPAGRVVPVPEGVPLDWAGVTLNRALTAQYLVNDSFAVGPGHVVLVHAAAGGVGQLLAQWCSHKGARVIGAVGSAEKVSAAKAAGCHEVLISTDPNWVSACRELTAGEGVHAVYDGIGGAMFEQSLLALRPNGVLASYGTPAGPIPPFDIFRLNQLGSLHITSPSIFTFNKTTKALRERSADVFAQAMAGVLRTDAPRLYGFGQAREAHIDLAARRTTGSIGLSAA